MDGSVRRRALPLDNWCTLICLVFWNLKPLAFIS